MKADARGQTIIRFFGVVFAKHNVPLTNITAVAADGALAFVDRYRATEIPNARTVHCALQRSHPVTPKTQRQ